MVSHTKADIKDLRSVDAKAELFDGEIVTVGPAGSKHNRAAGRTYASLLDHEEEFGGGYAYTDNVGFIVDLPNRQSLSPDAAWYVGGEEVFENGFLPKAPAFAVEVRSPEDYGPAAEKAILAKVKDYFAAGTVVVWDVDLESEELIRRYDQSTPESYKAFRNGDWADAEHVVVGWKFEVARLLRR